MDNVSRTVIILTGGLLLGFGILVAIWSIIAKTRGKDPKTIWTRYFAWFLIAPPIIVPLVWGRIPFIITMLILSLLCFREYAQAVGLWKDKRLMFICYAGIACIYGPIFFFEYGIFQAMPIYVVAFILTVPMQRDEYEHMIQKICLAVLGVVYFGWFFSHLAYFRNFPNGIAYVFLLFVLVEGNDAFAYLWGTLIGRHKLIPRLSPNKTVEGMMGAAASVIALAFGLRFLVPNITSIHLAVIAFALSIFGMCGDLTISFIKRDLKIKDMGALIPGHGGLLDRFDSIIFTAPLFFHFIRYFYGG
jgi:phosphatidate cytidylyltransferase